MNEQPCSLTEIVVRDAVILNLKEKLAESEEHYVALQESNNKKWTKINGLQADLQKLGNQAEAYKLEKEYWMGQYQLKMSKSEAQEAAYLKVIKALSNRD